MLPAQRVVEAPEPNEAVGTATPLPCGQEGVGTLQTFADDDWWRLDLSAFSNLWLATGPGETGAIGDTVLTLLDAAGAPLGCNVDGVAVARYSRLYVERLAAGTYFVSVTRGTHGSLSGSYTLDVRCQAPVTVPTPPIVAEGPENNDVRTGGVATSIVLPVRADGVLAAVGFAGDWDFWRFVLVDDSVVRARLDASAVHPGAAVADDPVLYLFDGQSPPNVLVGPLYAAAAGTWDQTLVVTLPAGSYQLAVRGNAGSQNGSYFVDVGAEPAAATSVLAGGCGGRQLTVATATTGPGAPWVLEHARIGTTFALGGSGLGAGATCLHVVGFAATSVDLTPFGAVGCTLEVVYVDALLQIADGFGRSTWTVAVPELPALLGTALHSQVAVLGGSNPLGLTLSNRVTAVLGN